MPACARQRAFGPYNGWTSPAPISFSTTGASPVVVIKGLRQGGGVETVAAQHPPGDLRLVGGKGFPARAGGLQPAAATAHQLRPQGAYPVERRLFTRRQGGVGRVVLQGALALVLAQPGGGLGQGDDLAQPVREPAEMGLERLDVVEVGQILPEQRLLRQALQ